MNIIATIPTVGMEEFCSIINRCIRNGIRYYRFNLSKINLTEEEIDNIIRKSRYIYECDVKNKIILDLPYPYRKPRIYLEEYKYNAKVGQVIECYNEKKENKNYIDVDILKNYFSLNSKYFCQDGEGELLVKEVEKSKISFICLNEFEMKSGKGITSDKLVDGRLENEVIEMINLVKPQQLWFSFVEEVFFVNEIRNRIKSHSEFYMKIENREGYNNLKNILKEECGIVIARGDLGLNINIENLFEIQKDIVSIVKNKNRKVYIATDFMNSMVNKKIPSRADLIDLIYAINLRCDGLMLNAPVIRGKYLKEVVNIITYICNAKI
ncbi:pyruvate kinase [Eubacterium sp.]